MWKRGYGGFMLSLSGFGLVQGTTDARTPQDPFCMQRGTNALLILFCDALSSLMPRRVDGGPTGRDSPDPVRNLFNGPAAGRAGQKGTLVKQDLLALSLGFGAFLAAWQPAHAQTARTCAARSVVGERLADVFGESRQSIGLATDSQVVEVFASPETGTWTIVVSTPAGRSCVVAAGQAFENLAERLPARGNPA